jgi:chromosome segregation ATPase
LFVHWQVLKLNAQAQAQGSTTPMWSKISSALKPREGNDIDPDHSDAQSTARHPPPDPFRANATTYYSHQAPPTPPPGVHSRTASREEDLIWSLRTQLALQQELCAQFEIDLGARDELVEALTIRLEASEKENDKRKSVVRSWKKKAADLERMCRHLEEEVDNSRQESMERSIMDEASGEALRQLHRQISQLEREKNDIEAVRNSLVQTADNAEAEMIRLRDKLGNTDEASGEAVRQLHHQISRLEREKSDVEGERNTLVHAVEKADAEITNLRGELSATDEASVEALRHLHSQISQLEQDKTELQVEHDALAQAREKADVEALKLREELDTADETNREALRRLHDQISQLEREKSDIDTECNSFAQAKEKADSEVVGLKEELDASNKANREALCRLHDQISQLERETGEVEVERNGLVEAMEKSGADVLRLTEELSITNEANREAQHRLHDQVSQLERAKGDAETERDDFSSEIVRLRVHIQQLQKDSAVMEVTIVQLNKQLDQDKEDINGLNIALESKQQELELVCINPSRSRV